MKQELCDNCKSALIKKNSGHTVYYECQHCGKREERTA